jgi:exopolysaccharide production protein ExoQ
MELSPTIGAVNTRETSPGLALCSATGFLFAFKGAITFLFFRSSPPTGAAVTAALTLGWMLMLWGFTIFDLPVLAVKAECAKVPRWILLYLGLAGASLAWTTTNSVPVAAVYWAAMAADVTAIWLLMRYEPVEDSTVRVMRGFITGAAVVAMIAWIAPAMDDMRLGHEDFLHPNFIGFEFAIAALFSAYLAQKSKPWTWICGAFVITTIRTLSKGTIVALLFAGLYYLLRGMKVSRKTRVYIGIAGSALLLSFWGLLETYLDLYSQGNNVETLTGRTYIWTTALDIVRDKPWFGYGFDSFRWVFPPFGTFQPWHAHNEWIQQLFAYGIVGLALVIGVYVSFYRAIRSSRNAALKSLATAILILVLVRSVVDTDRFELCCPLWLMTMLSITLAGNRPTEYPA